MTEYILVQWYTVTIVMGKKTFKQIELEIFEEVNILQEQPKPTCYIL